jgi:hypothetical protein
MTVPSAETVDPPDLGTLGAYYVATIGECDLLIETALELEQMGPIPALLSKRTHAQEALADLRARAVRAQAREAETQSQRLQRRCDEIDHAIQQQEARARPDVQGLAALYRRLEQTEAALSEALRGEQQVPTTPEQLGAAVSEITEQWPDDLLERAARVLAERHKGVIEMVRGGRRAKLGPDGWEAA